MSDFDHSTIAAETRTGAELAGEGAVPFHAALDRAVSDIAGWMFKPVVVSLMSPLVLGFAGKKVALYLAE